MTREEAVKFLKLMRKAVSYFEECGHDKASMVIECDKAEALDRAIEALSADAVSLTGTMKYLTKPHNYCEVVRCKDCRHIYKNDFCSFYGCPTEADGYCNNGERREE